ncbi:MotA/TolQ/ExbB proton channel family protein [Neisseria elongata]|uniref:MotA/TolQ/ExbB proton channel family protein n=1 Tax=Neisseria elongata TaxID=495 RepID=UPI00195E7AFE|nr:MotA/TolQ/ExbB proton channel family protein [Neisseria elongata]MBM7064966.1 MotA/TolQ/ExbB proton channel family protein [Neisseria elongata]
MDLLHVFRQGDPVLIAAFLILILMSVATWTIMIIRTVKLRQAKKANARVKDLIWGAKSLDEAARIARENEDAPMSTMLLDAVKADDFFHRNKDTDLASGVPFSQYLLRQIHHNLSQTMRQFDGGLTALASIGSSAPFIGLFGTVWGIYHALLNISDSGQVSIAAVAGPIGEALVATALGLFTAIPAVLAYNCLVRGNKTLQQDLHAFGHDLHIQILNKKDKE